LVDGFRQTGGTDVVVRLKEEGKHLATRGAWGAVEPEFEPAGVSALHWFGRDGADAVDGKVETERGDNHRMTPKDRAAAVWRMVGSVQAWLPLWKTPLSAGYSVMTATPCRTATAQQELYINKLVVAFETSVHSGRNFPCRVPRYDASLRIILQELRLFDHLSA
jgi:hypothetical protein